MAALSYLKIYRGNDVSQHPISKPVITIGRAQDNDVVLNDAVISRYHAVLKFSESALSITDLNSNNGTYIGEQRIPPNAPADLKNDDRIHIGSFTLKVRLSDSISRKAQDSVSKAALLTDDSSVSASGALVRDMQIPRVVKSEVPVEPLVSVERKSRRKTRPKIQSEQILTKYICMDIVGYTRMSVEAQCDVISTLNRVVKSAVEVSGLPDSSIMYIPAGDAIYIALMGITVDYDCHLRIALDILHRIWLYNQKAQDAKRFEVRIGINENVDNIIKDINDKTNIAGSGINYAQRVSSFADASQILVGRTVWDSLSQREKYMKTFRKYEARAKHGVLLEVFQYVGGNVKGLNKEVPSVFASQELSGLTRVGAYYFAHAIRNRHFLLEKRKYVPDNHALSLLMWYLAVDSVGEIMSTEVNPYKKKMPDSENNTLNEQFEIFLKLPCSLCTDLYSSGPERDIMSRDFGRYFEDEGNLFVNADGKDKLRSEWPEIWNEFDLDNSVACE